MDFVFALRFYVSLACRVLLMLLLLLLLQSAPRRRRRPYPGSDRASTGSENSVVDGKVGWARRRELKNGGGGRVGVNERGREKEKEREKGRKRSAFFFSLSGARPQVRLPFRGGNTPRKDSLRSDFVKRMGSSVEEAGAAGAGAERSRRLNTATVRLGAGVTAGGIMLWDQDEPARVIRRPKLQPGLRSMAGATTVEKARDSFFS